MEFYTISNLKRPIRLKEETRIFAYESLNFKYGKDTDKTPFISLDDIEEFERFSDVVKYDLAIRKIVENAPIRICENEMLSGAATLGMAINHRIPASYKGEFISSVSHLTINFEKVIKVGLEGYVKEINESLKKYANNPKKIEFLNSCLATIDSIKIYRDRYLEALKGKNEYINNYNNLLQVPFKPARNFYEAVQSIWFIFSFVRLCGNWPGIGRIDYMLKDYLKNDLDNNVITLDEAREILAHFFIKGCEWIKGGNYITGDAQHYQNLVLSGIDENGNDITNEVTYLVLDIIEELGISDFPTTIRINRNTSEKLLNRAAEVLRYGGGILAFYNEELVMKSLIEYGYSKDEVWKFANDGCWEVQIPGRTNFGYIPFDSLGLLQKVTLNKYENIEFDSFEKLYEKYTNDLKNQIKSMADNIKDYYFVHDGEYKTFLKREPCTAVALFEDGCIENGASYLEGGPIYNVLSPHIGGLADTVDSLYAIKKMVFDEKRISFKELMIALKNDWEGYEDLRQIALNNYTYYGNDNDEVDNIAIRIVDDFAKYCKEEDGSFGFSFPPGISTFGRQVEWLPNRISSAHGHRSNEILAGNCSPTPGTDKEGATAIIKSYCKLSQIKMVTGAALDLKLLASSLEGNDGIEAIKGLLRGFILLGGYFIQPDVENKEILKEAQMHPENYLNLSVRVSGWNARFVTLCKEWQDMIINEAK